MDAHHLPLEIIEVEIHLPCVAVAERTDFQVEQDVAAEDTMVEDEIDIVMLVTECDSLLPGLETKSSAQLEEECL